jgi:RNase P subunit RPR2
MESKRKEWDKNYYEKNKERIKERQRLYAVENKERVRQKQKEYYRKKVRTHCKKCGTEFTDDNKVKSGVRDDGSISYRADCKDCYAIYQKNTKKPRVEEPPNIYLNLPNVIANINSSYGWLS